MLLGGGDAALEQFSRLRAKHFREPYATIYRLIENYYHSRNNLPSINELLVLSQRNSKNVSLLNTLSLLDVSDIHIDVAVDGLLDQFAQTITLNSFERIIEKINILASDDILEEVGRLPLELSEEIGTDASITKSSQLRIFQTREEVHAKMTPTGISNKFDADWGGFFLEELVLVGGYRGTGKSTFCANLSYGQTSQGFICPYFTIEMTDHETFSRIMAIASGVHATKIRKGELSEEDILKLAKARARMFEGGDHLLDKYLKEGLDPIAFESELVCLPASAYGELVIIDDRRLSLSKIDTSLGTLKAKYGDRLKMVVVDYVNQVSLDGKSGVELFDWTVQTVLAKYLKELARKHNVTIVSPYQIDKTGEARFAKGLLDACDLAILLVREDNGDLTLDLAKARSGDDKWSCRQKMNWETLQLDPREIVGDPEPAEEQPTTKKSSRKKQQNDKAAYGELDQ